MPNVNVSFMNPRNILYGFMILLAFMQFYAVKYAANNLLLLFCMAICALYAAIYPTTKLIDKANFAPLMFLFIWLAYSFVSYTWAVNQASVLEYSQLIFIDLGLFFVFSGFFRNPKWLKLSPYFFFIIFCMYIATSMWEVTTLQHLPVSRYFGKLTFVPTGPFYNENNLAGFFLLPLPFVFFLPKLIHKQWLKIVSGFLSLGMFAIITVQGARIAMLAAVAFFIVGLVFYTSNKTKLFSLVAMVLLILVLYSVATPIMQMGSKMLVQEVSSISTEKETARMSSLRIRKQLFIEILDLTAQSKFFGVGAGNVETYMNSERSFRTGGITNPHNFILELLGDFGVIITAGFVYLYVSWLAGLYRRYKASSGNTRVLYLMYLSSLLLFIPASALPSSIKWNHLLWIFLAAANAMSKYDPELLTNSSINKLPVVNPGQTIQEVIA